MWFEKGFDPPTAYGTSCSARRMKGRYSELICVDTLSFVGALLEPFGIANKETTFATNGIFGITLRLANQGIEISPGPASSK